MPAPVMEHDLQRSPDMRAGGTQATTSTAYLSRLATAAPESRRSGGRYSPEYRYQGRRSRSPTSSQRTPYTSRAASSPSRQYWTAVPETLEDTVSERPEKRQRLDRWQPPFTAQASGYGSRTAGGKHDHSPHIFRKYFAESPQMSEFGDRDDGSPCARCYGSEEILHSVIDGLFDLHAELSRLRPASRAYPYETREQKATTDVTKQGLKHSLVWTVDEIRRATRGIQDARFATSTPGKARELPSLADVVPSPTLQQMRRPSLHGQSAVVATPTNEIRQLSFFSEAARSDEALQRTSEYAKDESQYLHDQNFPPIVPPHDMKRGQHYESGAPGSAQSPHPSSGSSAFAPAHSPAHSQHAHRSLPSPPTSHFPQSGFVPPSQFQSASQAAHASHFQDLQHQISTKTLALQTLQREHDQLLAAFSRSQIRCNTLDKKSQVSDHEINTLTEEKIRLQQQVESLESHIEELSKSRDEVHKQSTADGAQWRQIMAMSSQLQIKGAEDAKRYKDDRDAWEDARALLQKRVEELEVGSTSSLASTMQQRVGGEASSHGAQDPLQSDSVDTLRGEVIRLREKCAELEITLQEVTGETEQIEGALKAMATIRQRVANKSRGETS